ncbi:MAG: acyltransferase [Azoarcus sp.]|jgi:predicted LPLAT superfamily acyltransferase|nr:acyltransferase [Azoarcus sp.]
MHWARIGETGFLGGIRFLHWVYRYGGIWLFRAVLCLVMPWFFLSNSVARRASLEYLARLRETSGGATPAANKWNAFRHFMSFGENVLEKLIVADVRENVRNPVGAEGLESLHRLVDEGRGVLVVSAHFGNLMFLHRLWRNQRAHVRFTLFAHTRHAGRFNRFLHSLNPEMEIDLIQADNVDVGTAMLLSERVAAGGIVVFTGDRVPVTLGSKATVAAPFLGREAHFPAGPYVLAAALGCPMFMVFSARCREGFSVTARQLAERVVLPRREREAAIRTYLATYVAALTEVCVKYPLQWFNFYPFWRDPAGEPNPAPDEKPSKPLA